MLRTLEFPWNSAWHTQCSTDQQTAMRRFPPIRIVTMIAILLVASSVSARAIGTSECECCGPLVGAPTAPIAPCCVGTTDRRVAPSTPSHFTSTPSLVAVEGPLAALVDVRSQADAGYPPGSFSPQSLRRVLRI